MRSFLFRRLTLVLVAGLTVTSAACNSVLGIDEARYDAALDPVAAPPAGAAGGSSGAGGAGGANEPGVKGDARCLAYCSLAMSNCQASSSRTLRSRPAKPCVSAWKMARPRIRPETRWSAG